MRTMKPNIPEIRGVKSNETEIFPVRNCRQFGFILRGSPLFENAVLVQFAKENFRKFKPEFLVRWKASSVNKLWNHLET